MYTEWLAGLKPGDRVVVSNNGGNRLDTVSKVTATQVVCGNSRYRKRNGYAFGGDSWNRFRIEPPTTVILEKIEENALRAKIEKLAQDKATTLATLRAMYAAKGECHDR